MICSQFSFLFGHLESFARLLGEHVDQMWLFPFVIFFILKKHGFFADIRPYL